MSEQPDETSHTPAAAPARAGDGRRRGFMGGLFQGLETPFQKWALLAVIVFAGLNQDLLQGMLDAPLGPPVVSPNMPEAGAPNPGVGAPGRGAGIPGLVFGAPGSGEIGRAHV